MYVGFARRRKKLWIADEGYLGRVELPDFGRRYLSHLGKVDSVVYMIPLRQCQITDTAYAPYFTTIIQTKGKSAPQSEAVEVVVKRFS